MNTKSAGMRIRRGFVDVPEGQIHYRTCGEAQPGRTPLVMFHASPGSSQSLGPLMQALGADRPIVALDTLGNGDSSPPAAAEPDIPYFAAGAWRAIEALGLGTVDLYGTHTGANIAIEIALARPDRVRKVILDGVALYSDQERQERLARYAPAVAPADDGSHMIWAWSFVRDMQLFAPPYKRTRAYRLDADLPSTQELHDLAVEVLKALRTYHLSYNAAFRYRKEQRLSRLSRPTLVASSRTDTLYGYLDEVTRLIPGGEKVVVPGVSSAEALPQTAAIFAAFLDR